VPLLKKVIYHDGKIEARKQFPQRNITGILLGNVVRSINGLTILEKMVHGTIQEGWYKLTQILAGLSPGSFLMYIPNVEGRSPISTRKETGL
jgi:hypothetical protein